MLDLCILIINLYIFIQIYLAILATFITSVTMSAYETASSCTSCRCNSSFDSPSYVALVRVGKNGAVTIAGGQALCISDTFSARWLAIRGGASTCDFHLGLRLGASFEVYEIIKVI